MPALTSQQRSKLESAVLKARHLSETGARNALQALAVDQAEPFSHMSPETRSLRNRLRNRARLLGDERTADGKQSIDHLSNELAYEYWHKMLFAQFLAANNLLMHHSGVAVTLDECEELGKEEGHSDKWVAAAAYACKMLPAIFRPEDPLMQVEFSPNDRIALETLLGMIDLDIFTSDDSLGWVYQFWQSEAKEKINKSGDKIDGEKLPAVTQLFTEPYMVHFLIDNTLGAWWVSRNPGVTPPVNFDYLRIIPPPTGEARRGADEVRTGSVTSADTERSRSAAAGTFDGWPDKTATITSLDPCMGSGHFVASLFSVFVKLRMHEEGLTKEDATDKVISENLHGLELDPRCTQIAAFNLALTAWKFCGHYKELPEMNLACSGIAPKGKKEDWVKLVGKIADTSLKARMENGMKMLYDHFQLAPELGSLLDPSTIKADAFTASFEELQPVLLKALEGETDKDQAERGVMAAGIAKAGKLLSDKYTLQITNVPYLGRGRQVEDGILANYCLENYPDAKGELATVFMDRMFNSTSKNCDVCSVMPQNWLFLTTYKKFRERLLKQETWNFVARLGAGSFSQISGEVVKAILISISKREPKKTTNYFGIDVSDFVTIEEKCNELKKADLIDSNQFQQLENPDARIVFGKIESGYKLTKYAQTGTGLQTFDRPRFIFNFWEIDVVSNGWIQLQSTPVKHGFFSGMSEAVKWQEGKGELLEYVLAKEKDGYKSGIWKAGSQFWGKKGILHSVVGDLPFTFYLGYPYDTNAAVIIPNDKNDLSAIYCFSASGEFLQTVRDLDQKLMVTNATFVKVPFDLEYWQKVAAEKYPNGLPKPYSDDPTQWLFHGHPVKAETPLQVAAARILGYRWPAESDKEMELAEEARHLIAAVKAFDKLTDEDGIVCIPSVNGEMAAAERLRTYLQAIWGSDWNNHTLEELLKKEGSKKSNLEDWFREEFMDQHNKVFQNRPFIWHIWDGRKDGFGALVNYHKLTKENLQKLIFTYLGDWIRQCELKVKNGESGADGLLSAARKLKEKLELILEGEEPYDIFVRWKKLEEQPLGWDPDLNDGVRLNIRPFIEAEVLRKKPNVKWGIDRGKNPPGAPWGEIRDNDKHLSLKEKRNVGGKA